MIKQIFLLFMTLSLMACQSLVKDPKVEVTDVKVEKMTAGGATLVFLCDVVNPNSFAVKVDELKYHVIVNKNPVGKSLATPPLEVKANSKRQISLPVDFRFADVLSSVWDALKKQRIDYTITGDARVGSLKIPFTKSGSHDL